MKTIIVIASVVVLAAFALPEQKPNGCELAQMVTTTTIPTTTTTTRALTLQEQADKVADAHGIPRKLFRALIKQESGWNSQAVGGAGEIGLTQVMPYHYAKYHTKQEFRDNPLMQLEFGAKILSRHYKTFGSWDKALISYNAGASRARSGNVPSSTKRYVINIMEGI